MNPKEFRKDPKGSERIQKVMDKMGVAEFSPVSGTLNAPQKTNKPQNVKIKQINDKIQIITKEYKKSKREKNSKTIIEITTLLR